MYSRSLSQFLSLGFGFAILVIIVFGALSALRVPAGHLVDWVIGALTCWWLLIIVTVPWNIYFEAKGVIQEAAHSRQINVKFDESQIVYAQRIARRALVAAIALHVFSAVGLFCLSAFKISPTGYIGAGAALLLTVVRPAVRGYEYLQEQLRTISHRIKYPREDVVALQNKVAEIDAAVKAIQGNLDPLEPASLAARQKRDLDELTQRLDRLLAQCQQLELDNTEQHLRILRDSQSAISKISADTQFLDHVREIVKMIKTA